MHRSRLKLAVATLSLACAAVVVSCTALRKENPEHQPKVSMAEARAIALKKVPGTVKEAELEREGNRWVYAFDLVPDGASRGAEVEVDIDADSGEIIATDGADDRQ